MYDAVEVQQLIAKRELKMLQTFDQVSGDETCTPLIRMIFLSSDTSFFLFNLFNTDISSF